MFEFILDHHNHGPTSFPTSFTEKEEFQQHPVLDPEMLLQFCDEMSQGDDSMGTIDHDEDLEVKHIKSIFGHKQKPPIERVCIPNCVAGEINKDLCSGQTLSLASIFSHAPAFNTNLKPIRKVCPSSFLKIGQEGISNNSHLAKTVSLEEIHNFPTCGQRKAKISDFLKTRHLKRSHGTNATKRHFHECGTQLDSSNKRRRMNPRRSSLLPINLAIQENGTLNLIKILAEADPKSISIPDGPNAFCALHFALKRDLNDVLEIVDLLLLSNVRCAQRVDKHLNTPLHLACAFGASLEVIKHLHLIYPEALLKRNFNNETPLDIAQKRTSFASSSDVASYLKVNFDNMAERQFQNDFDL